MGLFDGLKSAKTSERGAYLGLGLYVVEVTKCVAKTTRNKGDAFILEFKIIESSNQEVDKSGSRKHGPGSSASWYQSLKDRDIGFGALKGFAAAVLGYSNPDDPEFCEGVEQFITDAAGPAQALTGMRIPLEVVNVKKKDGGDFSLHKWGLGAPKAAA